MKRADLPELHWITPIANLPSVLRRGILSHRLASKVVHDSIAMQPVQDIRATKEVPGGRLLHDYANLYVNARNPMLLVRSAEHAHLTVLRVDPAVLDLPGVVISDQNAASKYVRFAPAPQGLAIVDADYTFAEYWTHPDDFIEYLRHKSRMLAEVLVPDRVDPDRILGGYVSAADSRDKALAAAPSLNFEINPHLFFR